MPKKQHIPKQEKQHRKPKHDPLRTEANKRRKIEKHQKRVRKEQERAHQHDKESLCARALLRLERHLDHRITADLLSLERHLALEKNRVTYHLTPSAQQKTMRQLLIEQGVITPRKERVYRDYATSMNNPLH